MDGISIIVCCYNSENKLPETIKHLAQQRVPEKIKWEIIIIDNASKDNTLKVAINEWSKYCKDVPFKIDKEDQQGLMYAREKGKSVAVYDLLLFCDDDNWLDDDYVNNAYTIMTNNPNISILGGQTFPIFESNPPNWFIDHIKYFAIGQQNQYSADITNSRGWVWGAASIYRADLFKLLKEKNYSLFLTGRLGDKMTTGEDVELCYIAKLLGYTIYYDDSLKCKHFMSKNRFDLDKFYELCKANGRSLPVLRLYDPKIPINRVIQLINIKNKIKSIIKYKIYHNRKGISQEVIWYYESIGEIYGSLNIITNLHKFKSNLAKLLK